MSICSLVPHRSPPPAFAGRGLTLRRRGGCRLQPRHGQDLLLVERIVFQQGPREGFQLGSVIGQELGGGRETFVGDALDLGVDLPRGCFAVGPRYAEATRAVLSECEWSDLRAHAP